MRDADDEFRARLYEYLTGTKPSDDPVIFQKQCEALADELGNSVKKTRSVNNEY